MYGRMELIIILIVLRIFYSLFQSFRSGGGKPLPPQRPPLKPPLPPDFWDPRDPRKRGKYEKTEGTPPDIWEELRSPEKRQSAERPATKPILQPSFSGEESQPLRQTAAAAFLSGEITLPQAVSPRRKKVDRQEREYALSKLINSDNLIWGMVALEVLSPPRARKTFPINRYKPGRS